MLVSVDIEVVRSATEELVRAFGRLLPQLSGSAEPVTAGSLREIVDWPGTRLLVARVDGEIAGTLTLVTFPILTGLRAWIEDVVVDESARGQGVAEALNRAAIDRARAAGAVSIDLTSRPSREAANRLYQRIGFEPRETNVYRFSI